MHHTPAQTQAPAAIQAWHAYLHSRKSADLAALLHADVVFHSPVVFKPQRGRAITMAYLGAAMRVLGNDSFTYVKEVFGPDDAVLEFNTTVDGILIDGVDIISWNAANQITEFKVMVRPLQAVNKLHALMAAMLEQMQTQRSGA
jgi:hypothetical protein